MSIPVVMPKAGLTMVEGTISEWKMAEGAAVNKGDAKMEDSVVVLGREDEVVAAVLLHHIVVPHLLLGPGHLVNIENDTMIGDRGFERIAGKREHVVVAHLEVSAVVIEGCACFDVVRGIDVQLVVKHVDRRIGHVITGE